MKFDTLIKQINSNSKIKDISKVVGITAIIGVTIGTGVVIASKMKNGTKESIKSKMIVAKEMLFVSKKSKCKENDNDSIDIFGIQTNTEGLDFIQQVENEDKEDEFLAENNDENILF